MTRRCFEVGFMELETGLDMAESSPFFFTLPDVDPAAVAKVTIAKPQGQLPNPAPTVTVISSQNPPGITLETPNGGESWAGQQTIVWQAGDPDGDSLSYDVLYSPDNGQNWLPLAVHLSEPHYTLAAEQLEASQAALIKVMANDGFHTSVDQSDAPFTVASAPPNSLSLQGPATIQPGQTFEVKLIAHQINEPGLYGLQFTLHFDPSRVQVDNLQLQPNLSLIAQQTIENSRGQLTVTASQQGQVAGFSGDVTLATLTLTATQNEGVATLNLDNVIAGAPDGSRLNVSTSPGFSLTISR
ncbi:MAG: cohesin domain-containing protein [Anaerolineae bacterium]